MFYSYIDDEDLMLVLCESPKSKKQLFNQLLEAYGKSPQCMEVVKSNNSITLNHTVVRFELKEEVTERFCDNLNLIYNDVTVLKETDYIEFINSGRNKLWGANYQESK